MATILHYIYGLMAFKRKIYHRDEKCLNCGYPIIGNYCGECGQKAHLHKDSLWHMIVHFVGDYFHYDNKFWTTIKTMFTKPGLITKEYIEGKRVKYLNPIQLYIFVTTVFFVFFASSAQKDTPDFKLKNVNQSQRVNTPPKGLTGLNGNGGNSQIGIGNWTPKETTREEYDSVQNALPESERDGFILRHVRHKSYEHTEGFGYQITKNFSKVFFILLPYFAFLLAVLFFRRKMYFVDHIIFSIHFHSFVFILLIASSIAFSIWDNETFANTLACILFVGIGVYLFKALKLIYPDSTLKLIIKQILLFLLYLIGFLLSLILLIIFLFLFF